MATELNYNGVHLYNVVTREWSQEVRYDPSNTDAMYHVFRMRFEGLLHGDLNVDTTWVTSGATGNMPGEYMDVRSLILQTRGKLIIWVSDTDGQANEVFRCHPCGGDAAGAFAVDLTDPNRDVDNGPRPKAFRILQVIGAKSLRVSFEIECAKLVCGSDVGLQKVPIALNNRWSVDEDMDENGFLTRTIAGQLRLSAAVATSGIDAKWLVVPGLECGFRRNAIQFSTDKTGLQSDYRVVDRQVHTSAPWPATKMQARHVQSTGDGLSMSSEVHVVLEGPPDADKRQMICRAMQVIDQKLNFSQIELGYGKQYFPEKVMITDHIGEQNRVEASVRFREVPVPEVAGGAMARPHEFYANLRDNMGRRMQTLPAMPGEPSPYDPGKSRILALYGYTPPTNDRLGGERKPAVTLLLQCYLQQPCFDFHGIAQFTGGSLGDPDDDEHTMRYVPDVTEAPNGVLVYTPHDDWSIGARENVYTMVRQCSDYASNECNVQLPVAGDPSAGDDEAPQDTSQVFQLALGQCHRTIDVDLERAGAWPEVVRPEKTYTDNVSHPGNPLKGRLLRSSVESYPPTLSPDGVTRIYRVTAHHVYAMNRPPTMTERYQIGVQPQTKFKKTDDEVVFDTALVFTNKDLGP